MKILPRLTSSVASPPSTIKRKEPQPPPATPVPWNAAVPPRGLNWVGTTPYWRPDAAPSGRNYAAEGRKPAVYIVKPGDSLASIAQRVGMRLADLADLNSTLRLVNGAWRIDGSLIRPGQAVAVWANPGTKSVTFVK